MKRANLLDDSRHQWGELQVSSVYVSPSLQVLNFKFDPGQRLLMYSDHVQGEMSLVVIEGYGEFMGEEARRYPLQRGDVIISVLGEPHTFLATTSMRLLITITPRGSSCDLETPEALLSQAVAPGMTSITTNAQFTSDRPPTLMSH
jgi:quercetin dioxygenase-like cupin family protein